MTRWLAVLGLLAAVVVAPRTESDSAPVAQLEVVAEAPAPTEAALRFAAADYDAFTATRGTLPVKLPSNAGRFADPAILLDGSTYYAYATRSGQLDIPAAASADLVHWSTPTNALPELPSWAERGRTWAPSVVRRGDRYVMWYSIRHRASGSMCISVAVATQPLGPFEDRSERPALCQLDRAGSIDPDVFVNDDGAAYLVWKSEDNALGHPTSLWAAPLDETATHVGHATLLLSRSVEWQGLIIEGPALVRSGGGYYLFYGANAWATTSAAIGYARCDTPLGPCREASTHGPWLSGTSTALGPSGPQFFRTPSGSLRIAYHAWDQCIVRGCRRALFIDELTFSDGMPILLRPPAGGDPAR